MNPDDTDLDVIDVASEIRRVESRIAVALETFVTDRLSAQLAKQGKAYTDQINALLEDLKQAADGATAALKKAEPVRDRVVGSVTLKGLQHESASDLMKLLQAGVHPLLVGPAGSGKSMGAQLCAKALNKQFYVQSVGAQTSMAHIFGYMDATTNYRPTHFRTAYEHGGVFCMDEIDAGNANVLIGINSALANGLCSFPDAIVPVHKDFAFIATANTIGRGATAKYTGRNRLDEATLDRFVPLHWDYDKKLEAILAGDQPEEVDWLNFVWRVRDYIDQHQIQIVISTRAILKGKAMMPYFSKQSMIDMIILNQVPKNHHKAVQALA